MIKFLVLLATLFPIGAADRYADSAPTPQLRHVHLAVQIATREGYWHQGSLVRRFNNPCALVFIGQILATEDPSKYARFSSANAGWFACDQDLDHKLRHGIKFGIAWPYPLARGEESTRAYDFEPQGD